MCQRVPPLYIVSSSSQISEGGEEPINLSPSSQISEGGEEPFTKAASVPFSFEAVSALTSSLITAPLSCGLTWIPSTWRGWIVIGSTSGGTISARQTPSHGNNS